MESTKGIQQTYTVTQLPSKTAHSHLWLKRSSSHQTNIPTNKFICERKKFGEKRNLRAFSFYFRFSYRFFSLSSLHFEKHKTNVKIIIVYDAFFKSIKLCKAIKWSWNCRRMVVWALDVKDKMNLKNFTQKGILDRGLRGILNCLEKSTKWQKQGKIVFFFAPTARCVQYFSQIREKFVKVVPAACDPAHS